MNLPYGLSDFGQVRRGGYFYADKSGFLRELEDPARGRTYALFLRPRRFGKTLLLSLLEHYYDVLRKDEFVPLFGGLAIGRAPTAERNRYLVLRLEFTGISTTDGAVRIEQDCLVSLQAQLAMFITRYQHLVPGLAALLPELPGLPTPATLINKVLRALRESPHPVYLLIDEYDNFTNNLIAADDQETYNAILHSSGFMREFYKQIKEGTALGVVQRIFMTGVSPVTLNDLTSGFNIMSHVSLEPELNALCGLTPADVATLADGVLAGGGYTLDRGVLLDDLRRYYNGYRFSPQAADQVFNPTMVLHFFRSLRPPAEYPDRILDTNVRTDFDRLRGLLVRRDGTPRPLPVARVRALLADGHLDEALDDSFPLEEAYDERHFVSQLYFLGLLTIAGRERSMLRLRVPNYVIDRLYGEALSRVLEAAAAVRVQEGDVRRAIEAMASSS